MADWRFLAAIDYRHGIDNLVGGGARSMTLVGQHDAYREMMGQQDGSVAVVYYCW